MPRGPEGPVAAPLLPLKWLVLESPLAPLISRSRGDGEGGGREGENQMGEREGEGRKRIRRVREIGATVEEGIEKVRKVNLGKR
jgi:hypothetical protein